MNDSLRAPIAPPTAAAARVIELIEAESAYSQHLCAPEAEATRLGLHAERIGSATAILTRKSENLIYNRLVGLGQASPATARQLDRFVAMAEARKVHAIGVDLGAGARPGRLQDWLRQRQFERRHPSAKLWRDNAPLRRNQASGGDSVEVRRVGQADAHLWVDVVSQVWRSFGYRRPWFEARATAPGWRHYLAWIDGEPVGAGAMYVGKVGSTTAGHMVDGVTLRDWRCRGIQAAIIRKRLSAGRSAGCTLFTSETAPPLPRMPLVSFRNLCRQGFQLAYLRHPWKLTL